MLEKLHKITEEQVQKLLFYGLAVLVFVLPVPQLFLPESEMGISMQATVLAVSGIYFGFLLLTECLNKRFSIKQGMLPVKCIVGLVMVGVISVITSENKMFSLYGTEIRGEGFLSLLAYYMIFMGTLLLEKKEYRKKLLYLFSLLGVLVVALGVIQYTGVYAFGERFPGMAYVPMRNPNFYGGFTVLFTGVGMGGFFSYKKDSDTTRPFAWWNRGVWYVLVVIGYVGCICAGSALVYAGVVMMLLMYLFLEFATKRRRLLSFLALVAGLLAVMYFFDLQKDGKVTAEIKKIGNEIKAEGSVLGDRVGSGRMLIWKQTVALLPEYGVLGCGIECLGETWIEKYGFSFYGRYVDKAHNEYLNLWITEGFFALVVYLVFLFALFIPGMKLFLEKKKKTAKTEKGEIISKIAFFAFFGYIAQAFFNISVIQVAPYFWMICGLLYSGKRNGNEETVDC